MTFTAFKETPENDQGTIVQVNQQALVNILIRYPGSFDVFRELIQNADDAEADTVEIRFETKQCLRATEQIVDMSQIKVRKWIIRNNGHSLEKEDWSRLKKIADGNRKSSKVGAFGVGFYIVLSVCDKPLVKSNGKSLQMTRGEKLRVKPGSYKIDPQDAAFTSIELDLKSDVHEPLPKLVDLARFLISSITFLDRIQKISVFLDCWPLLCVQKKCAKSSSIKNVVVPPGMLHIESVSHTTQEVMVEAVKPAFPKPRDPVDDADDEDDGVTSPPDGHQGTDINNSLCDMSHKGTFAVAYHLYTGQVLANPSEDVKKGVESAMKALPDKFPCKAVYFNSEQHKGVVENEMSHLFQGSHGIFQDNNGRIFIGQSTRQTTGIGLHVGSHFLPTVERGTVDLTNGQVAVWNAAVFKLAGGLARVVYNEEMERARRAGPHQKDVGLFTMRRFAFERREDDGVLQHLKDGFFFAQNPYVLATTGIASVVTVRKRAKELPLLQTHPFLSADLSVNHRTLLIDQCKIPAVSLQDLVDEFIAGMSEEQLPAFFSWWKTFGTKFKNKDNLVEQLRSKGRLRLNGDDFMIKDVKHYTEVTDDKELLPPGTIYISESLIGALDFNLLGWTPFHTLDWLKYCPQVLARDTDTKALIGQRVFIVLTGPQGISCLSKQDFDDVKKRLESVECISTDKGMRKPSDSYFTITGIMEDLSVVNDEGLSPEVRQALERLGVRRMIDWNKLVPGLEANANADMNGRLLTCLVEADPEDQLALIEDLKNRTLLASEKHGRFASTGLYRPDAFDGKLRELGLPVLDLPPGEPIDAPRADILGQLGVREYPTLQKIVQWLFEPSNNEARDIARRCLRKNESGYRQEVSEMSEAFIPTSEAKRLATPREVILSSSWTEIGFYPISDVLQVEHDLLRVLGIEMDPPAAVIIDILAENPPVMEKAQTWLERLGSHQNKNDLCDLRDIPFVPIKAGSAHTEYRRPKDCFVVSSDSDPATNRLARVFPVVNFGEGGNSFLLFCGAHDGLPQAEDIARKMAEDPQQYHRQTGGDFYQYLNDLRDIAAKLGEFQDHRSLKKQMREKRVLLAIRKREGSEFELRLGSDILIGGDKENIADFGGNTFLAPEGLEKLYKTLGSEPLDKYVKYIPRIYPLNGSFPLPFGPSCISECIDSFRSDEQTQGRQSNVSIDEGKLHIKPCSELELAKKCAVPSRFVAPATTITSQQMKEDKLHAIAATRPVAAIFEHDQKSGFYTLWIAKNHETMEPDVTTFVAKALCRLLLQTHRHRDLVMMKKLLTETKSKYPEDLEWSNVSDSLDAHNTSKRAGKKRHHHPYREGAGTNPELGSECDPIQYAKDAIRLCPGESKSADKPDQRIISGGRKGKDVYCRNVPTESEPDANLEREGLKFFWEKSSRSRSLDGESLAALERFAKIVCGLAKVFNVKTSTFSIIWKEKDDNFVGFNRDGNIFLNLVHYIKHENKTDDNEDKTVITQWYFIIAHELAHNESMNHNGVHEATFAGLCVMHVHALYEQYPSCKKYFKLTGRG